MEFTAEKEILLEGTQTVHNIITPKSALPILLNILIETQGDNLRLTATDLDVGITCVIPVNIKETGAITVPAKKFLDIVRELPGDNVQINTKKNNLIFIESSSCRFKIMGVAQEEFPKLPELKDKEVIKIEQLILKEMLKITSFAVAVDEVRYVLNGILFKIQKNNLTLVATDGKRLAIIEKKLKQDIGKEIQIIIPIKTIQELNRNLGEDGELSLILGNNQVLFDLGEVAIISRLIEGEFPDYQRVIPAVSENKITLNREQFLLAVKRAALLSTPEYQPVKLEVFKDRLVISKSTPDIGESQEEIIVQYKGKEMVMGFNPDYLIDVLKNLTQEEVEFELTDSEKIKAGVIRLPGYVYLVMAMLLS